VRECQSSGVQGQSLEEKRDSSYLESLDQRLRKVEQELVGEQEVDEPPKE
jgi:hypothetical protein